jgi:hypothetical protein
MSTLSSITHTIQPEAEELLLKRKELTSLEQDLTERELGLSTLKGELHQFERRYNQIVGLKYRELDEVRAQVMELASQLYPKSDEFRAGATSSREQAKQSAGETEDFATDSPTEEKFVPSEELKKLFREVAKKIHPDLAENPEEQKRCHNLMSKLNLAYDHLDEEGIRAVLIEWEAGNPDKDWGRRRSPSGTGVPGGRKDSYDQIQGPGPGRGCPLRSSQRIQFCYGPTLTFNKSARASVEKY